MSLKYRIVLMVLILELAMMATVLWFTLSSSIEISRENITQKEHVTLELLSNLSYNSLITEEYPQLQHHFDEITSDPDIEEIILTDYSGHIVVSSDRNRIGQALPGLRQSDSHTWRTQTISNTAEILGVLAIKFSNAKFISDYNKIRNLGITIAIIGMAVVATAGLLTGVFLTRRLDKLASAAREMSDGNFKVRTHFTGRDEIATVGMAFDRMADQIESRTLELEDERNSLRLEVKQRENVAERLKIQQSNLLELTTQKWDVDEDISPALRRITEISSRALRVDRASIWIFNKENTELVCLDLYESGVDSHSSGHTLTLKDFPHYISAISEGRVIAAHDAQSDIRTSEFTESYLKPLGIISMLDTPLRLSGQLIGVLCHEHIGSARQWAADEEAFAGSMSDIIALVMERGERYRTEAKMRKLSGAVESSADSVFITDRNGIIEYVNKAFTKVTGFSSLEAVGKTPNIMKSESHDNDFYKNLWQSILNGDAYSDVLINRKKNGELYYEEKTITPLKNRHGEVTHFISTGKDITERMQDQERLHYLAYHDILTELPNRALFMDRLSQALLRRRDKHNEAALLFFDVDQFKAVNDTLGHDHGDELLKQLAGRVKDCLRSEDTLSRFGGDEFAVLIENINVKSTLLIIVKKIFSATARPFIINGHELFMTISIGITHIPDHVPDHSPDASTLIKHADTAMYRAKEKGRNSYEYYSAEMGEQAYERLTLESNLHRAILNNEFFLYYQPQVSLSDGEIIGAEALIRWQHPEFGFMNPARFIPMLEETGLIVPTGKWVFDAACKQVAKWKAGGIDKLRVAVNFSSRQFHDLDLIDHVSTTLRNYKLRPDMIEIEITESVFMQNNQVSMDNLNKLHEMGLKISLDDFGTGYSSLSYLKSFPVDVLKIDRSFICDLDKDDDARSLVKAMITMANSLNIEVIAEGVETPAQLDFLRKHNCDVIQGYLYSPPVPADELTQLFRSPNRLII